MGHSLYIYPKKSSEKSEELFESVENTVNGGGARSEAEKVLVFGKLQSQIGGTFTKEDLIESYETFGELSPSVRHNLHNNINSNIRNGYFRKKDHDTLEITPKGIQRANKILGRKSTPIKNNTEGV
jgi:hypothetical protein